MSSTLVVAFDGTDVGEDALALGSWLACAAGATALVVQVYPEEPVNVLPGIGSEYEKEMREDAEELLARARRIVAGGSWAQARVDYRAVPGSSVARGLDRVSTQVGAEMIVLGAPHRGGLRRIGVGKTADRLLHGSAVPVLIAPRGSRDRQLPRPQVIGCAFVPTPDGQHALRRAADLARRTGAHLRLFTVAAHSVEGRVSDRDRDARLAERAAVVLREAAQEAVAALPPGLSASVDVLQGGVVDALSALDQGDCQLLVCGSRGYGPVGSVLLGGVSGRLVRKAMCPVMVVPRGPAPAG